MMHSTTKQWVDRNEYLPVYKYQEPFFLKLMFINWLWTRDLQDPNKLSIGHSITDFEDKEMCIVNCEHNTKVTRQPTFDMSWL